MIFSERYKELIDHTQNEFITNNSCENIERKVKEDLLNLLSSFNEPMEIPLDRYDISQVEHTNVFIYSISEFYNYKNQIVPLHEVNYKYIIGLLSSHTLGEIFDIIELMYINLSDSERDSYIKELNEFFDSNSLPWRMLEGKMIKIDAQQFECDLKAKALAQMKELKDAEPKFQSAYTELMTAIEYLDKGDYQSAINNAGKSYESVLKVILGADRGNADKLTKQYMEQFLTVPDTMTKSGFRENVMMTLPFIRNHSGADHGAGAKEAVISKPMAKLAVNLAAALDTFLIEEYASK